MPMNPCPCYASQFTMHLCDRAGWHVKDNITGHLVGYTNGTWPWATPAASKIDGADGINFPPGVKADTTLKLWLDAAARSVPLEKKGETSIMDIPVWKFGPPKSFWQDASTNPDNKDYYMHAGDGLLNLTSVQHNAPIFASRPHFLGCRENLDKLEGVDAPDETLHDFALLVEPITGLAMGGAGRVQLNIQIGPVNYNTNATNQSDPNSEVKNFPNVTPALLPLFWVEDGGVMTSAQADEWKGMVGKAVGTMGWYRWVAGVLGVILLLGGAFTCLVGGGCVGGNDAEYEEKPRIAMPSWTGIASVVVNLVLIAVFIVMTGVVAASLAGGEEGPPASFDRVQERLLQRKASLLAELAKLED